MGRRNRKKWRRRPPPQPQTSEVRFRSFGDGLYVAGMWASLHYEDVTTVVKKDGPQWVAMWIAQQLAPLVAAREGG